METYKIKIYKSAQKDLEEIVDYLNTLSPQAANKYYDLIIDEIGKLTQMPERCALVKDTGLRLKNYRVLYVKNYMVFFVIKKDVVQIFRILYSKRQYENLV